MSSAQPFAYISELPLEGVPSTELAGRHADIPFTPEAIAQLANAFFQAPPISPAATPSAPVSSLPLSPVGLPVTTPSLPDLPAPSVVNTIAPHAPAKSAYGPPDIPQTTIPSLVPTPNIPAPSAPTSMQSPTRPFGVADAPQPGASIGQSFPVGVLNVSDSVSLQNPGQNDFSLAPPAQIAAYPIGVHPDATPGGARPQNANSLYFLSESAFAGQTAGAQSPAVASPQIAASAPQVSSADASSHTFQHPLQSTREYAPAEHPQSMTGPDAYAVSSLSPADPHRLSDTASLLTAPTPAPITEGLDRHVSPGTTGPAAHDALYFVSQAGGYPGVITNAPGQEKDPSPAYEPELISRTEPSRGIFDPYRVKKDFPILQQNVHGKPLIWLDNAATTQKPQAVMDRLTHFYEYENSNIHRAAHALAARSTDAYEAAREKVRRFIKAPSVKDIIFVRGTTEGINLIAQAWGRRNVQKGDEIVISWLEHHANIVPWQMLCAEVGARLRVTPVDERGQIMLEEYEKLLNPKTRIVSITQVSNALGTVAPVREMTAMAHRHGVCVVVDGAQSVSHMPIDVQAIDCDFFVFSGHKVFGPTGIGVVYGKKEVLSHMSPWQGGGNMIADVTFEKTIYQGAPERFEAGTGNIADAVGLGAAIDYVESIGMDVIARYEHDLLVYATEKMKQVPGLTLIGTASEKASVLSFVLAGHEPLDVGKALDREGIAVRAGHHCAQPILRRFGLEATVRPSLAFYNTCDDIDALVTALMKIQSNLYRRKNF
jgi:cysteine desulfurase/selenocysteine lyase